MRIKGGRECLILNSNLTNSVEEEEVLSMEKSKCPVNIKQEVQEEDGEDLLPLSKVFKNRGGASTALLTVVNDHVEEPTSNNLLINAVKVENTQNLNEFPRFVKHMLRSHVTHGFWLGLPSEFCRMYMPKEDCQITLVDDNEGQYVTNYIFSSRALNGGWKGFSVAHGLNEGDTLIFHLVEAVKFKVTIIRGNALDNVKPLTPLKKINSRMLLKRGRPPGKHTDTVKRRGRPPGKHADTVKRRGRPPKMKKLAALQLPPDNLEYRSAVDTSEVLEGIQLFRNPIKLENIITGQSSSSVIVNGMNIDSELSVNTRLKYYRLCCSQNACLHEKLIEGMNCKLVAGIVSETVYIADAIEAGNLRFSSNELDSLNKRLRAFEQMGMMVAFLRGQLHQAVVGTFKESKSMAKHSELGDRKSADYESVRRGNSMKHKELSGLGAVDTNNGFKFRDQGSFECRDPVAVESIRFNEENMDDDFMKSWMY